MEKIRKVPVERAMSHHGDERRLRLEFEVGEAGWGRTRSWDAFDGEQTSGPCSPVHERHRYTNLKISEFD